MNTTNLGAIYQIKNLITNKIYVGSSKNFVYRKKKHLESLRRNDHANRYLQNSYNKYGEESFDFRILELSTLDNLIILEQFYIDLLSPEYNILPTAGSNLGYVTSQETKHKLSLALRGKKKGPQSEEHRRKLAEAKLGKPGNRKNKKASPETRKKISEAKKGTIPWNKGLKLK